MEQPITSTSAKAITISLILIVISLAAYFMGMLTNSIFGWIGYAVFIIGIIVSISIYGKQINYISTFGNYFTHGFKITALITVIMIIFMVVFNFAFPEVKEIFFDKAREDMLKAGTMSEEQVQQGLEITRKFYMVFSIGGTLLGYMFFGTLAALVGAAITKKQPAVSNQDINQIR